MSGGHFDYKDSDLMYALFRVSWGSNPDKYHRGYGDPAQDREVSELLFDILNLLHDLDWYLSGDTCEKTYKDKLKAFKKKWFKESREKRLEDMIESELKNTKEYLLKIIKE